MEACESVPDGGFGHVDHPLLHQRVRDPHTEGEGKLMAVLREAVGLVRGRQTYTRTAYIRGADGREFTAAPDPLERA
ncbi:hypothetical protein [Streptomyces sp. G-G2]|uniref:hypothetical protein n=1 Tax=Streptomyces sp. G-G2 TaxID=3046201 RepID=UPI0024BA928E|nr:hypothetical protein [Streptomyces sp. G-G2]MDJ0385869.1 hypothetical protein [Streptomyces sp. G-G2]